MNAQLVQGGEVLAAEVAAITQLLLMALDVLKEGLQLLEGLSTGLHHTFVHLGEEGRATSVAHHGNKQGKSSANRVASLFQNRCHWVIYRKGPLPLDPLCWRTAELML